MEFSFSLEPAWGAKLITDLGPGECRWLVGEALAAGTRIGSGHWFCAAPVDAAAPSPHSYWRAHRAIAYHPPGDDVPRPLSDHGGTYLVLSMPPAQYFPRDSVFDRFPRAEVKASNRNTGVMLRTGKAKT